MKIQFFPLILFFPGGHSMELVVFWACLNLIFFFSGFSILMGGPRLGSAGSEVGL